MSIVFHYAPQSSATPVAWALAELEVPHEKVLVNLKAGEQRKPEFLALNPNGKVPTLVADGVPMFEALAIMMWLGDRFGVEKKLWPALTDPERGPAMAWSVWAYVTYGTALRKLFVAKGEWTGPEYRNEPQEALARKEIDELLGILDKQLRDRDYLLGSSFSLADLIVGSTIGWSAMTGVPVKQHERVAAWLARWQARPAFAQSWGG